jgi:hypothetical protein
MLLQPHQDITQRFSEEVEKTIDLVMGNGIRFLSRIQLDLSDKPAGDETPDLLYALRVYLTGDDSANAIRVTGVVDDE